MIDLRVRLGFFGLIFARIWGENGSKTARTYKIMFEVEPAIQLSVWGDHKGWKSSDFRAKISGQIVGQKTEQFPKFMQNNEKTTVF